MPRAVPFPIPAKGFTYQQDSRSTNQAPTSVPASAPAFTTRFAPRPFSNIPLSDTSNNLRAATNATSNGTQKEVDREEGELSDAEGEQGRKAHDGARLNGIVSNAQKSNIPLGFMDSTSFISTPNESPKQEGMQASQFALLNAY